MNYQGLIPILCLPLFGLQNSLGATLFFAISMASQAHGNTLEEYALKAAFVAKFLNYIEFETAHERIQICVFVNEIAYDSFKAIERENIGSASIQVRDLKAGESISTCHVLFVPNSAQAQMTLQLRPTGGAAILTIGETPGFLAKGGIISFFTQSERIRFEINPEAARRAGIKMSSKLLQLAKIYQE